MTHPITKTDNYILITSDEEIKLQDWCILFDSVGNLFYDIPLQYTDSKNQHINKYLRKVIAHLPPNNSSILEGVPLLPQLPNEEDDLDKESDKYAGLIGNKDGTAKFDFKRGYNKAKEKYKFTEEDMIKVIDYCKHNRAFEYDFEKVMESLSQPKLPVGFKCEMQITPSYKDKFGNVRTGKTYPKIINGVMQGEWIFE